MSRPSAHTDRLLVETARKLFPSTGISRLNLREVAKKAGVNLGMFHYYFKTKDVFVKRVLQDFYEEFFQNFNLEDVDGRSPLEKFRAVLVRLSHFVRDNEGFMAALIFDLFNREKLAVQFARENFSRHATVMFKLVAECQEQKLIQKAPPHQIMSFVMPAVIFPILVGPRIKTAIIVPPQIKKGIDYVSTDEAIENRIEMALRGISFQKGKTS